VLPFHTHPIFFNITLPEDFSDNTSLSKLILAKLFIHSLFVATTKNLLMNAIKNGIQKVIHIKTARFVKTHALLMI